MRLNQFLISAIATLLAVNPSIAADLAFVGVTANDLTPERAAALKVDHGAEIATVTPESPAAKAALQEKDVIVSFNDLVVDDAKGLTGLIRQTPPGTLVKLNILRGDNQAMVLQVQTTTRPQTPAPIQASTPTHLKDCAASTLQTLGIAVVVGS